MHGFLNNLKMTNVDDLFFLAYNSISWFIMFGLGWEGEMGQVILSGLDVVLVYLHVVVAEKVN